MIREFNVSLETIKRAVKQLRWAESLGNHCKTTLTIYDYHNSWCIDEIDRYLDSENVSYIKDESGKEYVVYTLELKV